MKTTRYILTLIATLLFTTLNTWGESLLDGKKWTNLCAVSNVGGTLQGAAYYNGNIYQFADAGAGHGIYSISGNSWASGGAINTGYLAACHFGSACFGPESTKNYTVNGVAKTSSFPLLFVTGHDKTSGSRALLVNVIDYQTKTLVASLRFQDTGTQDDMIAAYDFAGGKIYLMGYPNNVVGMAPWVIREYTISSFSSFTTTAQTIGTYESVPCVNLTSASHTDVTIGGPNATSSIQEDLVCGTLQDCHYYDGHIYFVVTRGSRYNRTEWVKVHDYEISSQKVIKTVCSAINSEAEGFAFDGTNFYLTTGGDGIEGKNRLFKLAAGSGYDALNFQPAPKNADYYEISTASQFVWFKQQVYSGCTTAKARLMADIDMTSQADPFTYYVYNETTPRTHDAQYAIRGEFDGNGHAISNVSITSTPHYNDGLFPYVEGANIHDLTVTGSLTATPSQDKAATGNNDVQNVGFIGKMNGGTLTNINLIGWNITVPSTLTSANTSQLIGAETGTISKTNILLTDPSGTAHDGTGTDHIYINGFCSKSGASASTVGYYETPSGSGTSADPYLINNAGKLWWFAKHVNGLANGNQAIHAKMTADINMEGSTRGSFPGIGRYQGAVYAGTFDGQGHTISNFYIGNGADRSGLFSYTDGATIKNFNISGELGISSGIKHGSVVGWAMNTTIEKVFSSVTVTAGGVQQVGGLVGCLQKSTVNRCRYSGTITSSSAFNKIAGLSGSMVNGKLIDCLFDGTLTLSVNNGGLIAGGLVACSMDAAGNEITNCLMNGTINISNPTARCGAIVGLISKFSFTGTNIYYNSTTVSASLSTDSPALENNTNGTAPTWSMSATAVDPTATGFLWGNVKNWLNNGSTNWGINGDKAAYPLPNEVDKDATPVVKWTVIFQDHDGTELQNTQVVAGTNISKPDDPVRSGYKFDGWSTDGTNIVTWPQVANEDMTFTAKYSVFTTTYTNGFKDGGQKTDADYYEEPVLITSARCTELGIDASYNTNGYYEVKNAGNMFWIAKNMDASAITGVNTRKYVMTADIDMAGNDANHKDWAGIGAWGSTDTHFKGTFDGNGHKFTNYYMNITTGSWKAMFSVPNGATIKNFTISGNIDISSTGSQFGVLGGRIAGTTTFEDIHSAVNITVAAGKTPGAIGGLVGQCSAQTTFNRCRYSGTITGNSSYNALGGIVGNAEGILTFNNCLFDGTISTTSTQERTGVDNGIKIGGIFGRNNNKSIIKNCLSNGTITVPAGADKGNVGIILGTHTTNNPLTITTTYFNRISGISTIGNNSYTSGAIAATDTTYVGNTPDWAAIKNSLNGSSNPTNWGINSQVYPVPGEQDAASTIYTITFDSKGGSACTPQTGTANTKFTLPTPTLSGYTFKGWDSKEDGTGTRYQGGTEYTITADATLYAQWTVTVPQYTITFNTNGGSTCESVTEDENSVITLPTPTKDGYIFAGWDTADGGTGTRYQGGASYTITANATLYAQWTEDEPGDYRNGFKKTGTSADSDYYEPATQDANGYYIIDNGGKLFWFANLVNAQSKGTIKKNAKITTNIDLENRQFPLIGTYNTNLYGGTFDGDGFTIRNFKYEVSNDGTFGRAFFTHTNGATIKNFKLEGTMTINNGTNPAFIASLVGMGASTTLEDVHSTVNITLNGGNGGTSGVRIIAGLAGRFGGTMNRCRYSGTIDATNAPNIGDRIAGICAEGNPVAMTNCLFDGTIKTACTTATHYVAGLYAKTNSGTSTATNCLVAGNFVFANSANLSNCGVICYSVNNNNFTTTNCYYVAQSNLTRIGVATGATAVGSTPWGTITDNLNGGATAIQCNWKVVTGQDYPIPMYYERVMFVNGFNQDASAANKYETPAQDEDGYYLIDNGGKLWWFATKVKNEDKTAKAKLTTDIDVEGSTRCTGSVNMPQIGEWGTGGDGAFTGIFDGQGYTISNWQQNWNNSSRSGLFGYTKNATIKNFTLEGTLNANGSSGAQQIATVVGYTGTGTTLEDVHSKANINANGGVWAIGGIVGRAGGVVNRCWYSGTITADANTYKLIGGIAGDTYKTTNNEYISNCLFDGTIIAPSSNADLMVGGIAGGASETNGEIKNCLMNGTITVANYAETKSGYVVGSVIPSGKSITVQDTYYRTDNVSASITASHGATTGTINDGSAKVTYRANMTNGQLVINLGSGNWKQGTTQPEPLVGGGEHQHVFNLNGFCLAGDGYESVGDPVDGWYEIANGGQLFDFATKFNTGAIAAGAKAKLTADINLENKIFPGIGIFTGNGHDPGTGSYTFTGEFNGQGHTIRNLYRSCTSSCTGGLFNTVNNAKIYNVHVRGKVITPSDQMKFGGVIGYAYGSSTLIEDIYSSVDITVNGSPAQIGGVIGRAAGTINRCRYDGTITGSTISCNQLAGICASARSGLTITNCLFDGVIEANYAGTSTFDVRVGGILAWHDNGNITLQNNLSNGTIHLKQGTQSSKSGLSLCGIVYGDINTSGTLTVSDNYYTTTNCTIGTSAFTQAGGTTKSSATVGAGCTLRDTQDWDPTILNALNGTSSPVNWIIATEEYPVPAKTNKTPPVKYTIVFKDYNGTVLQSTEVEEGDEVSPPADPTRSGYIFADWSPAVVSPAVANATYTAIYNKVGYNNGFNTDFEHCLETDRYQSATLEEDGYYHIENGGQLFWFANQVNAGNTGIKAKLTVDINMEGDVHTDFPGIGNATNKFAGEFVGDGFAITNYTRNINGTNNSGFFGYTNDATISNFSIAGTMTLNNCGSSDLFHGGIVGYADGATNIEDVTCSVSITVASGTGRGFGGIAGRAAGNTTINRCRYNGTINAGQAYNQIAGIVGNAQGVSISNSLFDGTIICNATNSGSDASSQIIVGGIVATTGGGGNGIANCLSNGTITLAADPNSKCGIVIGSYTHTMTVSNTYYTTAGATVGGNAFTLSRPSAVTLADYSVTERTSAITWTAVREALGVGNWKFETGTGAKEYPIPGIDLMFTITFDTDGGSEMASITQPAGTVVTAPSNPTKTGYDFAGWVDEEGNATTIPTTMPANNITLKATWALATFNVNYYVDNTFYQAVPVKYTETITPLATPTKERYTFSGWSEIPATMPAEDVNVYGTFTFTANASGVYEIGNQEDLFNFAAYVNATGLGTGCGHGNAKGKLIADIVLDGTTPFPGIGKYVTYKDAENKDVRDDSYAYTGTFDGDGHSITGYTRNASGNYGGFFNYTYNATISNFSLAGTMSIAGTGQQYGSVVGCSAGTTLVEDVYSSVDVTISSTAAQVGGFVGRAGGTYNRCRYSGTVSSETAFNKIGGFAGNITAGTLTNCLFDGTITLSANNAALMTAGLVASSFGNNPHVIKNCLVNGTMNISHPTDSCGIVVGYYEQALTVDHTYYTGSGRAITGAKGTLTGQATPVGTLTMDQLLDALNPTSGTDGNWEIKTSTGSPTYPIPSNCTIEEHVHSYNDNGFCISDDGSYEEPGKASDGWYVVDNAGKLWWLVTKVNDGTLDKDIRIRLTADIDMEGAARGSWPGFCVLGQKNGGNDWTTAFQGMFDGQGHTIRNYYYNDSRSSLNRRGFFNTIYNATIRKVNFEGTMYAYQGTTLQGVVIGSASGTSKIEDITSSVNIITNGTSGCGGVIGAMENVNTALTEMNRCRYNGTITLGGNNNKSVGGVIGELRSAKMYNCLFDGTITKQEGAGYTNVGGLVGKVTANDNSEIHRSLVHGSITLDAYAEATNTSGIVVGAAEKTIYLYKCYHTTNKGGNGNVTSGLPYIGPHIINKTATASDEGAVVGSTIQVDQLLGKSNDLSSDLDSLYKAGFRTLMGESNWAEVEQTSGNYTYPKKDEAHIHKYSNGFCTAGDGEYEKPSVMGKDYKIYNGGQLFWFAKHFNAGEIEQDATVEIMRDIDMEGDKYIYPGIGSQARPFKGVFNGHDHTIGRYYRDIVNAEHTGLINYAVGAEIKYFSIYGEVNFNLASVKSFHGTVLGMGINGDTQVNPNDTMLITDVFSFVNINCSNANVRVLGGIAGRTSGGVKRSRYSGTIKGMGNTASASGRQIAGIVANAREKILISDCLFSGEIWVTCQEADTMRVSGILASNEKNSGVRITIKNCLFNGCLKLQHTYRQGTDGSAVKSTENGVIAGYWDSNLPKFVDNVYYMKTCEGMDSINIGNWEGKNQQGGSKVETIEIKAPAEGETSDIWDSEKNEPNWNEIFKELDEYKEIKDSETGEVVSTERNGNWLYEVGEDAEGHPVPGGHICEHIDEDGNSAYDEFGYCTICGAAKPLEKDEDGKYKLELVSDIESFRDMVNDGDIKDGTILDCKLTADIDFSQFKDKDGNPIDFGEPIGNSNFNRYLYNFDGQGHKLLNVKIKTDDQYVGFFGFAGDDTHDCIIHDVTITGEIEVPYDSKLNDDKPMYMGVVGKMYRGKVYNVHSELTMRNTNPTRAKIGGIVGCCETTEGNSVVIDKCSYTGTAYINAAGNFGGILGQASRYTEVKNCTFAGNVHHTYKGGNNSTNFSGIVGYNGEPTFKGVKNCVVAGVLNTDPDREYVEYGKEGNHKNAIVGEDAILTAINVSHTREDNGYTAQYANNYSWNVYQSLVPANSSGIQTYVAQEKFINGEICAIMNNLDNAPSDTLNGHPWGQVLGYQKGSGKNGLGINDEGNIEPGAHTDGSPAQRVPIPGWFADSVKNEDGTYTVVKRVYKVVATPNATWNAKTDEEKAADPKKYDYIADWYYFDDQGDATPYPSDAASMKVKKIEYHREANYLTGYNSFCLPFEFTQDMKTAIDANAKIYTYDGVEGNKVNMTEVTSENIPAGKPFILLANSYDAWEYITSLENENNVSLTVSNPNNDGCGLYGSLNTIETGAWTTNNRLYKIKDDGRTLVRTTANSHCYPYRAYIKLPAPSSGATERDYELNYGDEPTGLDQPVANGDNSDQTEEVYYNVLGIRVTKDATGVILVGRNKKKMIVK